MNNSSFPTQPPVDARDELLEAVRPVVTEHVAKLGVELTAKIFGRYGATKLADTPTESMAMLKSSLEHSIRHAPKRPPGSRGRAKRRAAQQVPEDPKIP